MILKGKAPQNGQTTACLRNIEVWTGIEQPQCAAGDRKTLSVLRDWASHTEE